MKYLEITALGDVTYEKERPLLKVGGTGQEFFLAELPDLVPAPDDATAFRRLLEALAKKERITQVQAALKDGAGIFRLY
jgi:hypothetical protein